MACCIETFDLTKIFPVIKGYRDLLLHSFRKRETTALNNVNIQVEKGELFGLLGPNGAGKTTLIKILCTLILPTSGKAYVKGLDVEKNCNRIKGIIGYVISDERSFYWRLTGRQNLAFFAKLNNIPDNEAKQRIDRLLESMELSDDADRMFKDYSTGMMKKLSIIRGLLTNPDIIFMDEPTNGLDPVAAQGFRKFIKEKIVKEEKKTVVFATHNLHEAEELCDRVAILNRGEVTVTGTVKEIKSSFHTDNLYIIKLKNAKNGLLERISDTPHVKKVNRVSVSPLTNDLEIELELAESNGNIPGLIGKILEMGGNVSSFYEKDPPLEELFPKIVDKKR